jgi:exo-beta-1,3-glucanase (GH17 family)
MRAKAVTIFTLTMLVILNFSIWGYINHPLKMQSWNKTMMGATYNPLRKNQDEQEHHIPTEAEIDEDMSLLANKVFAVRTYKATEGVDSVPGIAAKHNLNVMMGAWIGADLERNRQEIENLVKVSRSDNRRILRTLVGNEVLYRGEIKIEQLIDYIREVRKRTWRPVSTSETWDRWLAHPELVAEVDFISVHILPYWEGISVDQAVNYVFDRYYELQKAFPGKQIVISEVGWPSDGQPRKDATASIANQAKFLRQFLNRASAEKITYYVIEAFDQPWKRSLEGSAGAYWGILMRIVRKNFQWMAIFW